MSSSLLIPEECYQPLPRSGNTVRLTRENASEYIGYQVKFKRRGGEEVIRTILYVTNSGVHIEYPELGDNIVFSRRMFVIL
jgi:hypothetical protein